MCGYCCYTVYDPKYCASCYYPVCGPCRKILDKNDFRGCTTCSKDFKEADRENSEVQTAMTQLKEFAMFQCEATTGAKID